MLNSSMKRAKAALYTSNVASTAPSTPFFFSSCSPVCTIRLISANSCGDALRNAENAATEDGRGWSGGRGNSSSFGRTFPCGGGSGR